MGLLGFLKKKNSDLPMPGQPNGNEVKLADLPPIVDPASVDSSLMERLPTPYDSASDKGPRAMSVNLPTLDFSMPPPDDLPEGSAMDDTHISPKVQPSPAEGKGSMPKLDISGMQGPKGNFGQELDPDDLNKLFMSDNWKEPDWENFDPYKAEKIEEPSPTDFATEELPKFDDAAVSNVPLGELDETETDEKEERDVLEPKMVSDVPEESSGAFFSKQDQETDVKPIELYIRGKAYSKVFSELDQMRKSLVKLDGLTESYEDMLKREEPLLSSAKEQMEYAYRRLSQIDKKIFVQ